MADKPDPQSEPEPTERLPKTGLRVPVPKREDVMDAIRKVSRPDKPQDENDESS